MKHPDNWKDSTTGGGCPDDEALSRFLDGELESAAAAVGLHVAGCPRCMTFLEIGALMPEAADPEDEPVALCTAGPQPEDLVAYLAGVSAADDSVEQHLRSCSQCVRTLMIMQSRQRVATGLSVAVPAALQAAVMARVGPKVRQPRSGAAWSLVERGWTGLTEWLSVLTRLPVLVPASFAAGALVVFVAQQMTPVAGVARPVTRWVETRRTLPVTALQAPVRAEPHPRSAKVATLGRGTIVDVIDEQADWYRVRTRDGNDGWVERRAFE